MVSELAGAGYSARHSFAGVVVAVAQAQLEMVLAVQRQRGSGDGVVASSLTSSQCGDGPLMHYDV